MGLATRRLEYVGYNSAHHQPSEPLRGSATAGYGWTSDGSRWPSSADTRQCASQSHDYAGLSWIGNSARQRAQLAWCFTASCHPGNHHGAHGAPDTERLDGTQQRHQFARHGLFRAHEFSFAAHVSTAFLGSFAFPFFFETLKGASKRATFGSP